MKNKLFKSAILFMVFSLFFISCEEEIDPLQKAQLKFKESTYISYDTNAYYPMVNNKGIRKVTTSTELLYDSTDPVGYKYAWKSKELDKVYRGGELKFVSHKLDSIRVMQPSHFGGDSIRFIAAIKSNFPRRKRTPIGLIENDWKYVRDSVFDNVHLTNYYREAETRENNGVQIVIEHHIFIDDEGHITRFERKTLNDYKVTQVVVFAFSNYTMSTSIDKMEYQLPNYPVAYGRPKRINSSRKQIRTQ